jgi:hypothetical protein
MLLEDRGWTFHRIWSTDWFSNPDREVARTVEAYKNSLKGKPKALEVVDDELVEEFAPVRKLAHPGYGNGAPITDYTKGQIDAVIKYILSDDLLRTDDEIVEEASKEIFGFAKTGSRIKKLLLESIHRVRGA